MANLGLGIVFVAVPLLYIDLNAAGVLYFAWLASATLRPDGKGLFEAQSLARDSRLKLFRMGLVTNLLNPFLQPAPNTPDPLTPLVWGLLAWVRRTVFNEAPTIAYDSSKNVQTGQTVTFGESSDDEMCFSDLFYYPAQGANFVCSGF